MKITYGHSNAFQDCLVRNWEELQQTIEPNKKYKVFTIDWDNLEIKECEGLIALEWDGKYYTYNDFYKSKNFPFFICFLEDHWIPQHWWLTYVDAANILDTYLIEVQNVLEEETERIQKLRKQLLRDSIHSENN